MGTGTPLPASVGTGRGLYRDTVTVYNALGEVDRHMRYARTVLHGVYLEETSGSRSDSTDGILVIIPAGQAGYVEPQDFSRAPLSVDYAVPESLGTWTLREGDLVVAGECELEIPPSSVAAIEAARELYHVTRVVPCRLRGRLHHLEVEGS